MKNPNFKHATLITIFVLMCASQAFALGETSIIRTSIFVSYDNNTDNLKITGENLEWNRQLSNMSGIEQVDIVLSRSFMNSTEVSDILVMCRDNFNFSQRWKDCIDLNGRLSVEIADMINQSNYDACLANVTFCQENSTAAMYLKEAEKSQIISNNEKIVSEKDDSIKSLTGNRNLILIWAIGMTLIAIGLFIRHGGGIGGAFWPNRDKEMQMSH